MIAVIQRVSRASVETGGRVSGSIGKGLLVLVCAVKGDHAEDAVFLAGKISRMRVFEDVDRKMNRSLLDAQGEALVVSQFTLAASTRKGNRPSFDGAEAPDRARDLYEAFIASLRETGVRVSTGVFGEMMTVALVNDGPVTFIMDSRACREKG